LLRHVAAPFEAKTNVSGHSRPATDYQLKTGHFREVLVRRVGFSAFLLEDRYGE
jgi:hypothetical protein